MSKKIRFGSRVGGKLPPQIKMTRRKFVHGSDAVYGGPGYPITYDFTKTQFRVRRRLHEQAHGRKITYSKALELMAGWIH